MLEQLKDSSAEERSIMMIGYLQFIIRKFGKDLISLMCGPLQEARNSFNFVSKYYDMLAEDMMQITSDQTGISTEDLIKGFEDFMQTTDTGQLNHWKNHQLMQILH